MISNRTIQARLSASFEAHRDNIAVEYKDTGLTYDRLDRYSNRIANRLTAMGIEKESFIGIMLDDKIALITVILGVIKAGCVFAPLDSGYPEKRTADMLSASDTRFVFTGETQSDRMKSIRRRLPHPMDIFTLDERFYLPGHALELKRHGDATKLTEAEKTRYARQLMLDGWGVEGQERLKASKVFVAGAGGSGSPLLYQLALCGFGTVVVCDFDTIELSNLNRQSLHDESRIGMNKALSAKMTLERLNPNIDVIALQEKITGENVFDLVGDCEIIFDNVDSLEAKSHLSRCATANGIPHTISSMIHINAYACVFHTPHTPCFHCLYDKRKIDDITRAKARPGQYKVIPNSVASPALHLSTGFVVNEAVKILVGMGEPAYNKYFHFNQFGSAEVLDTNGYHQITYPFNEHFRETARRQGFDWSSGWNGRFVEEIEVEPDPNCPFCGKSGSLRAYVDGSAQAAEKETDAPAPYQPDETTPPVDYRPADKLSIYFTSGTTGTPRAVLGKNESLTHFISWEIKQFGIDDTKRVSQLTSQCHDPFMRDLFVPLCAGGAICIPPDRETILDGERLRAWLAESRVNLVHTTPSLFRLIDGDGADPGNFEHLQYVLLAGEKITPRDLEKWYGKLGDTVRLVNVYGPTETTLAKLFYLIDPADVNRDVMPIGQAIPGAKVIILDKELNVCGPGEIGEIYIRTPFRGYGYCNDPELTAARFIQNPFSDAPGDIIYRTGDMGKINRDGDVEFVGREDRQVKIRGFRVELDEIEKRLREYPGVEEAVVLYRRTATDNYILCAYVKGAAPAAEVKESLGAELPDYMVPSFFIKMDAFPLNTAGKVNYKALPEPDAVERLEYTAPRNELEKQLTAIWSAILGIAKIGVFDGFLDMGGNSLNAMNLTSRVYKSFGVNLPLSRIFENPTPADLAETISSASAAGPYEPVQPVEERSYYPLSSAQLRMYLLRRFAGEEDTGYNQPKVLTMKGKLDRERLETAFRELIARHDALRTGFETIDGQPVQRIHPSVEFEIENVDSSLSLIPRFIRPFDLSKPPLLRVGLIRCAPDDHILIFDIHHIVSDGVTTGIFIDELMTLYHRQPLPRLPIQYKDYAVWQQQALLSEAMKAQEAYWLEVFADEPPVLDLPTDYPRPAVQGSEGAVVRFDVASQLVDRLEALAAERNVTLYMVLSAAFNTLLHKYTGREDMVVGSPIAGRSREELQRIPGVFINTLAMRNFPTDTKTFDQLLTETAETAFRAYENQDYPFETLVEKLTVGRHLDRNPLFDVMFIFQNIDMKPVELEGLVIEPYRFDPGTAKFDLSLIVLETGAGYDFSLEYAVCLFRPETMERFRDHFITLLEAVAVDPGRRIGEIDIISSAERELLLHGFNDTRRDFPEDKTLHQLFEETAARFGDRISIMARETHETHEKNIKQITYSELSRQSDHVASILIEKGAGPDSIVGIMADRSPGMIAGILGILKAGAAYMPIDPGYPEERIRYMLADSGAKIVLSESSQVREGVEVVDFDNHASAENPLHAPRSMLHAGQACGLAYVIYTSGSTGAPKGVMMEHRSLVNLVWFQFEHTSIDFSRVLQFAAVGFDVSAQEIFSTLLAGGRLCLIDEETKRSPDDLFEWVAVNEIRTVFFPTAFLKLLMSREEMIALIPGCVRHIVAAGEQLILTGAFKEYLKRGGVYLHNHYGPTETHVATALTIDPAGEIADIPSIGGPVSNTAVYILDGAGRLQPLGVPGELVIAGAPAARGYLNDPRQTAERFGEGNRSYKTYRSYRTGDLCRRPPAGGAAKIEYLGRIDRQIKIRGFRVEPGEIESCLLTHPAVEAAAVTAPDTQSPDSFLCAYTVAPGVETAELTAYLSQRLPDYMIPARFVALAAMPLTANGKINRRALPLPDHIETAEVTPPRTPLEQTLAGFWSEILMGEPGAAVGIDADFFVMGGHSLKAILLLSRIHEAFGVKIPLVEMFRIPTIRQLAGRIEAADRDVWSRIEPAEQQASYELSFNQRRLWILQELDKGNISYNMPLRINLGHAVDETVIRRTLAAVLQRHESLRTWFKKESGSAVQVIEPSVEPPFRAVDISEMAVEEQVRERERLLRESAETPFDLSRAPLLRALLVKSGDGAFDLLITMHHIITDGWSIDILKTEFSRIYEAERSGTALTLPPPALQYKDFSQWHNARIQDPESEAAARRFWLEKLTGGLPPLRLPVATGGGDADNSGAEYRCFTDSDVKNRLKKLAETHDTTLSVVMLSIYTILLAHLSNQEEVACLMISAGRDHPALQEMVGYFTTSTPVKTRVDAEMDFHDFLGRFHDDVMAAVQHQSYPLEPILDELGMTLPDIPAAYNMLNIPGTSADAAIENTEPYHQDKMQGAKFDLTLFVTEYGNGIELQWHYRKALFKPAAVESIAHVYLELLNELSGGG